MKRILATELKLQTHSVVERALRWLRPFLLGMLLFSRTAAQSQTAAEAWVQRFSPGEAASWDSANRVAIDAEGNAIVVGTTGNGAVVQGSVLIKYSGAGVALWTNRYGGVASTVVVDDSGNAFVTGYAAGIGSSHGFMTVAYSGAGVALWTNWYNGTGNQQGLATAIAVDNTGHVFVTGYSIGSGSYYYDYATIAYSGAGVALWTNRYNGRHDLDDVAVAIAVDNGGNVFVTGTSRYYDSLEDYATIAYSGAGVALWTNRYNGPRSKFDYARAVTVDGSGNVFVTGSSSGIGSSSDYATIAYSGAGEAIWTNRYNGPSNLDDLAYAMAVDSSGNVFVTGYSARSGGGWDFATIAYSGAGVALWTNRYNGPDGYSRANALAAGKSGNVFVTGFSRSIGGNLDYATIAYSASGAALWTNIYNGSGNGDDGSNAVAVDDSENVYVTGFSVGSEGNNDYATIKYVWRSQLGILPFTAGSSTVNLTLSGKPASTWSVERALMISGPWTNLGPSLIGPNGLGLFQDANPPAQGAFYRAMQP